MPKGVGNRSRQTEKEHCEIEAVLMLCSRLRDEMREDRRHHGEKANLQKRIEQKIE
jgi:hypothetical protein